MKVQSNTKIIVIVGPTASGKTALAIELAKKYNGEIISADSRQVYRGLDIGTAKDKSFPQHLIDIVDLDQDYNVTHFVRDAKKAIEDIAARGKLPIIVGGTGFWIDALVYDYSFPEVSPRGELREKLEHKSWQELFAQLEKLDPQRAKHIDKHNKRRLIRALEIANSGTPSPPPPWGEEQEGVFWLGIKISRDELDARIAQRLNEQFDQGLIEETKKLKNPNRFGLAYVPIAKYLKGEISETEMRAQALRSIIQYSKRQMTWFKRNKNIRWIFP